MLKKRIIASITVKEGWAVQSFGFGQYLPLGRPEVIAQNFDRWGADEILLLCFDRSTQGLGPDFETLQKITQTGINTPLIYAGGIRNHQEAIEVVKQGADRVQFDSLVRNSLKEVNAVAEILGSQAVIGSIPVSRHKGSLHAFDYITKKKTKITSSFACLLNKSLISELILIDHINEGTKNSFDLGILNSQFCKNLIKPLLLFGGLSESSGKKALKRDNIAGIGLGNFLSYSENSIGKYKEAIKSKDLRSHVYQKFK